MKHRSINLLITTVLVLCASKMILAAELSNDGQLIINQFQTELKARLKEAIAHGGPVNAISVCATDAPLIASRLSRQNGVKLQRLSTRYRNPLNMPSSQQQEIIHYLENNPDGVESYFRELGGGRSVYAKTIRVEAVCLTCHGRSVSEEVLTSLQKNYPYDMATGYQLGDFRGIFSVQWGSPNP